MDRKWANWVVFGSVLMMIVGAFKLIAGIIGLFRDQWLVLGYTGYRLVDITGLAIWYICIGAILFLGGIAALQGSRLGRVVGAVAAALAAISELFLLPYYPVWSIIMLVLYVIVMWAFIAWRGLTPYEAEEPLVMEAAPAFVAPPLTESSTDEPTERRTYDLAEIEGVGPAYAEKLGALGLKTTDDLLAAGASPKGRTDLAAATGISNKLILRWVNMADFFRVNGIGEEYSDLLEAAGVDTVPELAQRRADSLTPKLAEVNAEKTLVRRLPTETQVAGWIEVAKGLPRVVTY